ncbi:MAG: DNA repair protein RecN, partial [Clostridia bacterium]|nr:DNA repair protein RecN [Clostridia bacterium]
MINTLHIKNIGIIEELNIDMGKGLNILTGETGAGKTLIIDSLQIICGGRFSKEMIRKGSSYSYVELCIYDPNSEIAEDGNIIITREINLNGKNMCKINGRMVTVNELSQFMRNYIEIHGQNENQSLLDEKKHIEYLDNFIGAEIKELKENYGKLYEQRNQIMQELKANFGDEKERQRKLDLLQYQADEIEEAGLKIGEEEELEEKRKIINNSEKISESIKEAEKLILESGIDSISLAIRSLEKIENIDLKYEKSSSSLKTIYYELQELSRDISEYSKDIYFDEEERNYTEERLGLIYSLKRKYGNSIQEIIKYKEETEKEIERIQNLEEYNKKLMEENKQTEYKMNKIAEKINKIRKENSQVLNKKINQELEDLEMKNAKINIHVDYDNEEYYKTGKDIVTFYITTNIGENEKELSKIASGGEMSRIMLAIKKVLAQTDKMPVLIFDEIDTGISGKAANSVASKLKTIASKHQVICISHLPNIAAVADFNYFISKNIKEERTTTQIKLLKENEVIEEIARISSGEINEATLRYATDSEIYTATLGSADYLVDKSKSSLSHNVVVAQDGAVYIACDYLKLLTDFQYTVFENPSRILVETVGHENSFTQLKRNTQIRKLNGPKSPVLEECIKGETVNVIRDTGNWSFVISETGVMGYIKNNKLGDTKLSVVEASLPERQYKHISIGEDISLAWHQANGQSSIAEVLGSIGPVDVISPTWFYIKDNNGNIASNGSTSYVSYC